MTLVDIQWDSIDTANIMTVYYITVSPPVKLASQFFAEHSTFQLCLLYNQLYEVRVVSSNCFGNSTDTSFTIQNSELILATVFCLSPSNVIVGALV